MCVICISRHTAICLRYYSDVIVVFFIIMVILFAAKVLLVQSYLDLMVLVNILIEYIPPYSESWQNYYSFYWVNNTIKWIESADEWILELHKRKFVCVCVIIFASVSTDNYKCVIKIMFTNRENNFIQTRKLFIVINST